MPEFLLERYVARTDAPAIARSAERARAAAAALRREGACVRFVRSIFVPEDETCFDLYEAASAEQVREAAGRAGVSYERLTEAIADSRPPTPD